MYTFWSCQKMRDALRDLFDKILKGFDSINCIDTFVGIKCLMCPNWFVGVLCLALVFFINLLVSFPVSHIDCKETVGCFTLIFFLLSCDC